MFKNIKMSLADLLGKDYTDAVAAVNAVLGGMSLEEAEKIANEKVGFFPEEVQKKNSDKTTDIRPLIRSASAVKDGDLMVINAVLSADPHLEHPDHAQLKILRARHSGGRQFDFSMIS